MTWAVSLFDSSIDSKTVIAARFVSVRSLSACSSVVSYAMMLCKREYKIQISEHQLCVSMGKCELELDSSTSRKRGD